MTSNVQSLSHALDSAPLVAILRGLSSHEAIDVGTALAEAGIRILEVPLNSPDAFDSIEALRSTTDDDVVVGAGTVLSANEVSYLADVGGQIAVAPNTNVQVIDACAQHGIVPLPGFASATEAFLAINAGATFLKLFPADNFSPNYIKALKAVFPDGVNVLAVGGVESQTLGTYFEAGFEGVGVGSALYKPGTSIADIHASAVRLVGAYRTWSQSRLNVG